MRAFVVVEDKPLSREREESQHVRFCVYIPPPSPHLSFCPAYPAPPSYFMNDRNSYLLKYDGLVPVKEGAFKGHLSAEPSETHLRHLLRHLFGNRTDAKMRGRAARADMTRLYAPHIMGGIVAGHLKRIEEVLRRRSADSGHGGEL